MKEFIKVQGKNLFLLNTELLGLKEAQLWVGSRIDGPTDNDNERVLRERAEEEKIKGKPGVRISGIEAVNLIESELYRGWFEVDVSNWQAGIYRINIHSRPNVEAPLGTPLRPIRDGQYSWPNFSDEALMNLPEDQKKFLYLEKNNAGFCMRIEITLNRDVVPSGDGLEWIEKWPKIKKEVEKHYEERMKKE